MNPLFLYNLLSYGDIMVKPKIKQAFPDVHAMIDLKMEYILKKAKKKAKLAVVSIITKDPGILDDDEHEWLDLIAKHVL